MIELLCILGFGALVTGSMLLVGRALIDDLDNSSEDT